MTNVLQRYLPLVFPLYTADSFDEALELAVAHRPLLLLLDIEVNGASAFDLLPQLPAYHYAVIFTTAHEGYASQAFRVHAADYLLKPIIAAELREAVHNAVARIEAAAASYAGYKFQTLPPAITMPTVEGFSLLRPADILYGKAAGNYTELVMRSKTKITSSATLGHFESQLQSYGFFRIHRSFLINVVEVVSYRKGEGGFVEMSDGAVLEISRYRKADFLALFKTQEP